MTAQTDWDSYAGEAERAFAAAELSIAGFALASKWLYYDLLYASFPGLAASPVTLASVLFLSLLFPTTLMGITLPLLSKAVTHRTRDAARRIGALYALNTLGSAVGALVTAVVLDAGDTAAVLPRRRMTSEERFRLVHLARRHDPADLLGVPW